MLQYPRAQETRRKQKEGQVNDPMTNTTYTERMEDMPQSNTQYWHAVILAQLDLITRIRRKVTDTETLNTLDKEEAALREAIAKLNP